ncbi:hypothetical protein ACDW_01610 [Acidovorax sp. DW039]|uniref:hypothetical protein n=1 Tax=Acidovorax sp. DW039 TaxID=3095606 RepID=UPI00308EC751|nr:hypothetical protein ACDW_01610 [Acidovorax sp. DW039]
MDSHRTSARWVNEAHPFSGKSGWLCVAFLCVMVALGFYWEAPALGWLGAALLLGQALGYRKWQEEGALIAKAQASADWMPARLAHEQFSSEWGWKLEVSLPDGAAVWFLTSTGHFRKELPLPVEVCDIGGGLVVIRYEDRLVLTRVEFKG